METATTALATGVATELVLLTADQERELDGIVRRLHCALLGRSNSWLLTIADQGSSDDTLGVARRLSAELSNVRTVHLPERLDRRELRRRWAASAGTTVAFVELDTDSDIDAILAPLGRVAHVGDRTAGKLLTRRSALMTLGGAGLGVLLVACGKSASTSTAGTATANTAGGSTSSTITAGAGAGVTTTTTAGAAATASTPVALAAEMTEGPYYLDLNLVRSDITEDRAGAPLEIALVVVAAAGKPVSGAAVDIWHCDANGLYSGFVSASAGANRGSSASSRADDGTFLRGTQVTDAAGKVTFKTIYPGWYTGRTVHIHVKVHVSGKVVHTGQLFFDDTFTDTVFAGTVPYSSRGNRDTRNARDSIYSNGGSQSVLDVKKSGSSYATTMTMAVKTA